MEDEHPVIFFKTTDNLSEQAFQVFCVEFDMPTLHQKKSAEKIFLMCLYR